MSLRKKILFNFIAAALIATALTALMITGVLCTFFQGQAMRALGASSSLVAEAMERSADAPAYLSGIAKRAADTRYTWIGADGQVLYDSQAEAANMENHLARQEIVDALRSGSGESTRFSSTQGAVLLYYARRLGDGSVIRLASEQSSVWSPLGQIALGFVAIVLLALGITAVLARRLTLGIVRPVNAIDLDEPEGAEVYEEIVPLIEKIAHQKKQIAAQIRELGRQKEEFLAITGNMAEALLVLDAKGIILAANKSAQALFGVGADAVGKTIFALDRSIKMQNVMKRALLGQSITKETLIDGRAYQLIVSPVSLHGAPLSGIVMLLSDISDRYEAEKLRREFTANVSHELRTPLTSIAGYAELIQNGLASPEDVPDFAEKIGGEADRLIVLIEDIMRLSQLDEGMSAVNRERVDLRAVADRVCGRLLGQARQKEIVLDVKGNQAMIEGIPNLIDEMLFNMVDNAIKYSKPGGHVSVDVSMGADFAMISVRDDGIGIPARYHDKVFERFFRVDKSHSRETGGTGLGLSIVKHGVQVHGASIHLCSEEGAGTEISIRFPSGAR